MSDKILIKEDENLERNKNRSFISSNITNKNILVIGDSIEEISIANKILTPETLNHFYENLLKKEVYIGTSNTYVNKYSSELIPYFVRYVNNDKLSLVNQFSYIHNMLSGDYYGMASSDDSIEKRTKFRNILGPIVTGIYKVLQNNKNYKEFELLLNDRSQLFIDTKYVELKTFFPILLELNEHLKKEQETYTNKTGYFKDELKYIFELKNYVEAVIKKYIPHFEPFIKLINSDKNIENYNQIFFDKKTIELTSSIKGNALTLFLDQIMKYDKNKSFKEKFERSSALNDFSINVLNHNKPNIKEEIELYLQSNPNIKTVVFMDGDISKYKYLLEDKNLRYKGINFIFNKEVINYTYLSPENIVLHSLKNKNSLSSNIKETTFYTDKHEISNSDTLNIENLFLFNVIKNTFYGKEIQEVELKEIIELLSIPYINPLEIISKEVESRENERVFYSKFEEKNLKFYEELEYLKKFGDNNFISKLNRFREYKFNELKINLNVIGLEIGNKNDVIGLAAVSDNIKYMQLVFKTLDGNFSKINDFDISWYINDNENNEITPSKRLLLDVIIKKYRKDVKFLLSEKGKNIRSANDYFQIKKDFYDSEKDIKSFIGSRIEKTINMINKFVNLEENIYKNLLNDYSDEEWDMLFELRNYCYDSIYKEILNNFNIVDNDILYFQQGFMDKVLTENFLKKHIQKTLKNFEGKNKLLKNFSHENIKGVDNYFNNMPSFLQKMLDYAKKDNTFKFEEDYGKFYNFDEILIDGTELTKFRNYFENISKWFELNYQIDRVLPINKIFNDLESILKGNNVYGVKDSSLPKLIENVKIISNDPNFKKMKDSYILNLEEKISLLEEYDIKFINQQDFLKTNEKYSNEINFDDEILKIILENLNTIFNDDISYNIQKRSSIINHTLLNYFDNKKENSEQFLYQIKGEISSKLDNKYLLFRKNERKFIKEFLDEVVKTKDLSHEYVRKFRGAAIYLLETLNVNIDDLVLENIFNKKDRTKINNDFYLYQIIRIYINNLKILDDDILINLLKDFSLLEEKLNSNLFFEKTNLLLNNIEHLIKETSELKNKNVKDKDEFNERNSIVKQSFNLFDKTTAKLESAFDDFSKVNYEKIKKDVDELFINKGIDTKETLVECSEMFFENKFLSEVDLENRKEFISYFIVIPGNLNFIFEQTMKKLSEKFKVSFLIFIEEDKKVKLKKIYNVFTDNLTENKKYKFEISNKTYTEYTDFEYDKNLLELIFPVNMNAVKVSEMNF